MVHLNGFVVCGSGNDHAGAAITPQSSLRSAQSDLHFGFVYPFMDPDGDSAGANTLKDIVFRFADVVGAYG